MCDNKGLSEDSFKVPDLLLEAKQLCHDVNVDEPKSCEKTQEDPKCEPSKPLSKKSSRIDVALPYEEPEWSGSPPQQYSFEVIKNGTSVSVIDIETSYLVFGRLDVCNVVLEHPSVSRYHAIVQYCKGDETHHKGFYLYDLGSTHGTFLNKDKIMPRIYYKLKVGYIVKFGGSTRLHLFQGPEEEEETAMAIAEVPIKLEKEICTWGMGEDAEEEDDLSENPFALATPNENLYLDDPKKTLRGWFEREGYELEYDVEEKGFKNFSCRIQLPIDNPTGDFVTIEASVSGKKKEAVVACALEACRTLDRYGLLRQSKHESRQQKKKKWEDDDYYDSDEDTYLDRTGTIEKKREIRKKNEKKPEVETFQSLEIKLKAVTEEIAEIEQKLSASANSNAFVSCDGEEDSLEAYMSSLKDSAKAPTDKVEKSKLKFRLISLEKERNHLERLLEIARPAKLPPITKYPGMVGKKFKSKLNLPQSKPSEKIQIEMQDDEEEVESDDEKQLNKTNESELDEISDSNKTSTSIEIQDIHTEKVKNEHKRKGENPYGLLFPGKSSENKMEIEDSLTESRIEKVIGPSLPVEISIRKKQKKSKRNIDVYSTSNSEYSTWVPPAGQSGDGKTHLNDKYGY